MHVSAIIVPGARCASGQNGRWGPMGSIARQHRALSRIDNVDENLLSRLESSFMGTINAQLEFKIDFPEWEHYYKDVNWVNKYKEDLRFHPIKFIYEGIEYDALWYLAGQNIHAKRNRIEVIAPLVPNS